MRRLAFVAATLALAAPAVAQEMRYPVTRLIVPNQFSFFVTQTGPLDFHVQYRPNRKAGDYWCAAGYYATQFMHTGDAARIYRASYPPLRAGQGISFTLDPAGSVGETGLVTLGGAGDGGMTANGAYASFCFEAP